MKTTISNKAFIKSLTAIVLQLGASAVAYAGITCTGDNLINSPLRSAAVSYELRNPWFIEGQRFANEISIMGHLISLKTNFSDDVFYGHSQITAL